MITGTWASVHPALAAEPSLRAVVQKVLDHMEIEPQAEEPDWARPNSPPLFTFAWMSDFHLDATRLELVKQAFAYVDEEVDADFVMITGDNGAYAPGSADQEPVLPITLRRQRFLHGFLAENLRTPYVIIPGDNWPQDFDKVFGASQFSFDYGGIHFLFTSLDRCTELPGLAAFDEATWEWMRGDLDRNQDRPCLFIMHEHIAPPSFLDAGKAQKMLEEHPQVVAALCGHLHADVELQVGRIKYLLCPGLGPNPRHGFKTVKVYREALILRTVEYNAQQKRYEQVMKWQRIDVPESLRSSLHRPKDGTFTKHNYSEVPPHPYREDPELLRRTPEMIGVLTRFLREGVLRNGR